MSDTTAEISTPSTAQKLTAELLGTFVLVLGVAGTAMLAAGFMGGDGGLNVGFLGVALALGLSVVISAYAFGPISGGHFNPAVSVGLAIAGRFAWKELLPYIVAQIIGGLLAASALYWVISAGPAGSDVTAQFTGASTGYDVLSPGGYGLTSVFVIEVVTTAVFLFIILGVTAKRAAAGFAPLAIGFTLTVLALIAIPVSNASFNPARSLATAVYGGPDALGQLWVSIAAPIIGAIIAAVLYKVVFARSGSND